MTVQEACAKGQNAIEAAKRTAQLTLAQAKNEALFPSTEYGLRVEYWSDDAKSVITYL